MRPPVYGDALNIARRIEACRAQHSCQLITDVSFESRKLRSHQLRPARAKLIALRQSRFAGRAQHEQNHGLVGFAGKFILAEADREIECRISVVTAGRNDLMNAQALECSPVADGHVRVHQRNFHQGVKRVLLLLRKLGTQIRNHHVVASQNARARLHALQLSAAHVRDFDFLRRIAGDPLWRTCTTVEFKRIRTEVLASSSRL